MDHAHNTFRSQAGIEHLTIITWFIVAAVDRLKVTWVTEDVKYTSSAQHALAICKEKVTSTTVITHNAATLFVIGGILLTHIATLHHSFQPGIAVHFTISSLHLLFSIKN